MIILSKKVGWLFGLVGGCILGVGEGKAGEREIPVIFMRFYFWLFRTTMEGLAYKI